LINIEHALPEHYVTSKLFQDMGLMEQKDFGAMLGYWIPAGAEELFCRVCLLQGNL
jgi:hypothetical protein